MMLYLSSYRLGNEEEFLKKWVKSHDKKVLIIINAQDIYPDDDLREERNLNKCADLLQVGFEPEILDLREYFNKPHELRRKLANYRTFYVIGGNTFVLRRAMMMSGFDKYLHDISSNDEYLYIGYSAGICVLGHDLHGVSLEDDPYIDPYGLKEVIWNGVGLIDFMPIPHYGTYDSSYSTEVYMKEHGQKYQALRDGEVIIMKIEKVTTKTS